MSTLELLQLLTALASALAVGLLWATRRRERQAQDALPILKAKDATIAALTQEVQALRELTPGKIQEYLTQTHDQLKTYCQTIEAGYRSARKEIEQCNGEITRLQERGEWRADPIDQLVRRREALIEVTRAMRPGLRELQHQCEFPEPFSLRIARVYPASVRDLTQAYLDLATHLPLERASQIQALSDQVLQACKYRLDENTLFASTLSLRPAHPADQGEIWQRPDNGE